MKIHTCISETDSDMDLGVTEAKHISLLKPLRNNRIIPDVIGHYAVSIKYLPIWSKVLQGGYLGFWLGFTGR